MLLTDFDRAYCRQWCAEQVRRRKPAGAKTACNILHAFGQYLVGRGWLPLNPVDGLHPPSVPDSPARALSEAQTQALIDACATDRERLLIVLLLGTGLRRAELAGLRWPDVNLERQELIVTGKGRRVRTVLIPKAARELMAADFVSAHPQGELRQYRNPVSIARGRLHSTTGSIFGLAPDGVAAMFKRIARRARVRATAHQLRHTYATRMLAAGMSPLSLQTLGGWSSQQMVERYARAALTDAALDEARRLEG